MNVGAQVCAQVQVVCTRAQGCVPSAVASSADGSTPLTGVASGLRLFGRVGSEEWAILVGKGFFSAAAIRVIRIELVSCVDGRPWHAVRRGPPG